MVVLLLILHGLVGVALLGAITHQAVALCAPRTAEDSAAFLARYARVSSRLFCRAVVLLFIISVALGSVIYPTYRLDVRVPLEELQLGWAVGLFEVKEHFGGIGLFTLPLYAWYWSDDRKIARDGSTVPPSEYRTATVGFGRKAVTWLLAVIVWFSFLAGHVLNNLRGLGT